MTQTTPNGTKDLRQAAVFLLNEKKEKLSQREAIISSARNNQSCQKVPEWIIVSWQLEAKLLEDSIGTIQKWIIEDSYNW